ncbi:TetR/AcrR family transcriptional regulator [Nocardioides antri]|uniref:TetR/AcrR family transcriptional regulator n=1 Tax=Nocardioides antri TaxID=2607659 RepID=A0A5B1M7H7_9ACTN|nr:TetR/AcrR family transcriptional regulator [Nocardioides antri]KAA1428753.1 TetR/AcrR family transcriptional regulator [Nocardioides antri]
MVIEQDQPSVAETKQKVIRATVDLIDRSSYSSVTIDAVARASGVSRSTIYRHWPSRQALVLEAFTDKTDRLTAVSDSGDALADLRTYLLKLAFCLDFGGAASTVAGLIADAIHDEELAHTFRATLIRGRRREFFAILLRGQKRGQVRQDIDIATVVDALYGAVHHRLLVTRQPIDEPFVSALVRFAAEGLLEPSTRR